MVETMSVSEAAFGKPEGVTGTGTFDKGIVQKNIQELQQKIMQFTDELAMLRAESDLKERAEKLEQAIQTMVTGSRFTTYSKMKEALGEKA
jgi:phage shock protein A